jgi:hypothetical protein
MKHSWKTRGLYAWRVRKPHALLGLSVRWLLLAALALGTLLYFAGEWWWLALLVPLFAGRRWAYVGQTSSRYHRDRQHQYGDSTYGAPGASWSDLEPKAYPIPCLFHGWKWARLAQERMWITLLLPVYNIQGQAPWNLRKVNKQQARDQRWARDARRAKGPVRRLAVDFLVTSGRLVMGLAILAGLGYFGWEHFA